MVLITFFVTMVAVAGEVDIEKVLARGINFDHIFFPYDCNHPYTQEQWKTMREKLKESEFKQVADLGFTHVRLNLGRGFLQDLKPPYKMNPEGLALVDQAVDMALKHHLAISLDMHQTPAPDIFHDAEQLKAYQKLWAGLTQHFSRRPLTVLFELMNEPAIPELAKDDPAPKDIEKWKKIQMDLIAIIHKKDPKRYIVVTGGGWGSAAGLLQMGSLGLPRLVYTFHDYEPFIFTHQGATWVDKGVRFLRSIHYPVTKTEVQKNWETAKKAGYPEWPFKAVPKGFDREDMRKSLEPLFEFGREKGIVLYCGEFGVHKPYAPSEDRARWYKDMTDLLRANGVPWSMWAYHAGFDLADANDVADPSMVKALGLQK
jgi:aryl-phospho-beta-D-glucosidase BglC (GH1 family)